MTPRLAAVPLAAALLLTGCDAVASAPPVPAAPSVDEGAYVTSLCAATTPGFRIWYGRVADGWFAVTPDPSCHPTQKAGS